MGVHGLWELLAPVGRRVSVETLTGKKLAIDASIWMIQFMKAIRDERGEMVRNAHILGFFRRICKLLFLRTKPVFVFDGGTPALKRRTVAARRRHRENARAKIRKTAEKLLLNHLKSKRLEELAEGIKRSKSEVKDNLKGEQVDSVDNGSTCSGKDSCSGQSRQGFDRASNQERLDELLAASISAEEEAKLAGNEPVPTEDVNYEEDGEKDDEEEMIFHVNSGNIDPAVLAALPPSIQLDLLDQMRERLMADNRQKYQKIKKVPAKFSELQIQSYLKTVAFRREIDEVQKCASGRGFGGLQTSRIASEANREYIFSSSFTGDKQLLTPTCAEKKGSVINQEIRTTGSDKAKRKIFMSPSKPTDDMSFDVVTGDLPQDVETYMDERGRVRVSRVRGLGIHMTRDLKRNLDLMKEHEEVSFKKNFNKIPNDASDFSKGQSQTDVIRKPSFINEKNSHCTSASSATEEKYEEISRNAGKSTTVFGKDAAIEISFLEDEIGSKTMIDNYFMNLVSEVPTTELISEHISLEKNNDNFESECIWEVGMVGEQNLSLKGDDDTQSPFVESKGCEEDEILWEDSASLLSHSEETDKLVSLGFLEEDAELNEAIRRSLEDAKLKQSSSVVLVEANMCKTIEDQGSLMAGKNDPNIETPIKKDQLQSVVDSLEERVCFGRSNAHQFEESDKAVSLGFLEEEADLNEAIRRSLEDVKLKQPSSVVLVEANMSATIDDQSLLMSGKNGPNIETPIEKDQLQSVVDFLEERECLGRSNAHQFISSHNEIFSKFPLSVDRFDGESTRNDYKSNLAVCNSDVGLSHDIQVMEQGINQSSHGNLCKIASKVVADEPKSGKIDDHVLENYPSIGFENPYSRLDTCLGNVLNNSVAFPSTNTLGISSSKSSSSVAMLGIDLSRINSAEKMAASIDKMQQLTDNDVYKDSAEGLSFGDQTSMQEEDNIAKSEANLHDEISLLKQERAFLGDEQRKLERNAESVSSEMFAECQELLQMFGLPYIIAPMEAEAQCAYMEMNNLVDGIVTDDSDVFLFGARNVYKNIFDDRKYVETYFMKDIENELGLSREKLIRLALLLGSDYTEGVSGIGIVNAIEVINGFPEKDGFIKFKEWVESPDLDGMENNIVCSASKDSVLGVDQSSGSTIPDAKKLTFMDKHRNVSKNWHFPPSFPSDSVINAYISPQIDESIEPFAWGKPDLPLLRKTCWEKFGWPSQKADDLLVPVLKEYNKHETQLRMEAFYSFNERFAKIRSQRIKKAVKGITGINSSELTDIIDGGSSSTKKRSITRRNKGQSELENHTDPTTNERKSAKHCRKKAPIRTSPLRGKCKRGELLNEKLTESSDDEMHRSSMKLVESPPKMRRSTRQRRQVNYAEGTAEAALQHDEMVTKATTFCSEADCSKQQMMSQDYLHSGGGFCSEENEISEKQPSPATESRRPRPLEDGENSNFLVTGGGFCVDDETNSCASMAAGSLKEELSEANHHGIEPNLGFSGQGEAAYEKLIVLENLGGEESKVGNVAAQSFLSSMPSLKRKRKKSMYV
ncbi:DNA repair protein UVH3 isoform X2 [Phalaenopsis equestris]|uniref:DNA repair protein UVH3 isoform X2 n=1 Tax=Phalaenopsis equestris TaxID=78828 RepID=UPI0009E31FCA|nr:DNA repair protein UVH3 isoform X2 [Phalaenopsis equestris]